MDSVRALKLLFVFALFGLGVWLVSTRAAAPAPEAAGTAIAPRATTPDAIASNAASARADQILDHALEGGALTKGDRDELVAVVPAMSDEARADLETRMRAAALRGDLEIHVGE